MSGLDPGLDKPDAWPDITADQNQLGKFPQSQPKSDSTDLRGNLRSHLPVAMALIVGLRNRPRSDTNVYRLSRLQGLS